MPREIQSLSESKKQALKKMSKEEWNTTFQGMREKLGSAVADQVIAMMILSDLEGKATFKEKEDKPQFVRLDSLNGAEPDTYISVPLWLYNKRQFTGKVKGEEIIKNAYTGIDVEYKTIPVFEARPNLSNFEDGQKVYLNDVKVFAKPSGELSLSVWEQGDMKEIVEEFKQPEPIALSKLNDGYYCCIEAIGLPGSFRQTDYGTVRFEVVDEKKHSVKIVMYKEVVSKLLKEGKINVEMDKLDRCRLRIFGIYIEKLVRPTYTEVDFINVWDLEVIKEIEYPTLSALPEARTEEKAPEKVQSTAKEEKTSEKPVEIIEDLQEIVIPKVIKALKEDMLDDEFIEMFGQEVHNSLLHDGVIQEEGGIISLVADEPPKEQLKKEEEAFEEHKGKEPTEPPKEATDEEIELCGILKQLDNELEKCGVMKGVEVESLEKLLKWGNGKVKRTIELCIDKGDVYESNIGRFKPI
jgi:hypothetical protein